jgi:hypothetical protein
MDLSLKPFCKPPMKPRVNYVCRTCGSDQVRCDAYAAWDVDSQQWEIAETYDKGAWCEGCDGETTLKAIPLAPGADSERAN